jgi:hypothetical protein
MFGWSIGEKAMRKLAIWAAGALLTLGATMAQAGGFTFSVDQTAGPAGFDIIRFYAKLTPDLTVGAPFFGATGMQSIDATGTSSGTLKFNFFDQSADGIPDWDPTGAFTANDVNGRNNNSSTAGTFIRPGYPTVGNIFMASSDPVFVKTTDNDFNNVPDPGTEQTQYQNLKSFRVAAVIQGGQDVTAVTDPKGSLIGKFVVPTGSSVTLTGSVAADVGPITPFSLSTVPEPAALSFVGLAGLFLARRRRAA